MELGLALLAWTNEHFGPAQLRIHSERRAKKREGAGGKTARPRKS